MKNLELAKLFEHAAEVLALLEENAFKIIAYRKIARVLEELPDDIEKLAAANKLETIPGIGKSSADHILEYLRSGQIAEFEDLFSQIPAGVLQMMKIPTLGPKTASILWREGGITSIEQLKAGIDAGTLAELKLKGLGEKKLQKIRENLAHLETTAGRLRLGEAFQIATEIVAFLKTLPGVIHAQYCGSLRRGKETIGDIDIAVCIPNDNDDQSRDRKGATGTDSPHGRTLPVAAQIADAIRQSDFCGSVIQAGPTKTSFRTPPPTGIQVDVRIVPEESFGAALQYFTGSQAHNVKLREMAIKKGLKLNEWGVFKVIGNKEQQIAGDTEESVYAALGLPWIPPELREDHGELETRNLKLETLVALSDIRGDLHLHTTASDGTNSIDELIAEAKRRGYQYIAITDHSKSQFQANGLKVDRLIEHVKAIRAAAKEAEKSGILVLAGSEVDILADGSLDYEDEILTQLDWVVASPHTAFTQDTDAATQRLVRAVANPYVHVIGHPTGRKFPSRRGLEPDMSKVIFAAARNGTALEINANDERLDLRDVHVRMAVDAHVPICINTDAHALDNFNCMIYGILTARRGWASKGDVLNTRSLEEFKKWRKQRKEQAMW